MSLGIYHVEESDLEELSYLVFDGFAENPVNRVIYPKGATRSTIKWNIAGDRRGLREDNHAHYLCVRTGPDNPIMSYALWYEYPMGEDANTDTKENLECPPDSNADAFREIDPIGARKRQFLMKKQPFMYLADLVTIPAAKRQGAASLLLKWGMERAKAVGIPCYLQASPEGSSLYKKHGFVEIDRVIIDLRLWKSPVPQVINVAMLWPSRESGDHLEGS